MKRLVLFLLAAISAQAAPSFVDLRTVMRLAGANHEEVEFARRQHAVALLESREAWQRFWPTLGFGASYKGHEGRLQDVVGAVFDARKQQYTLAGNVVVDWAPGDIYFGALAARQRAVVAGHLVDKVRSDTVRESVDRYYDLLSAEAALAVIARDVAVTERYHEQLAAAVKAETAFRGDLLKVGTQLARLKLQVRLGEEALQVASARLAETLRVDPISELRSARVDLTPVRLVKEGDGSLSELVARAQINRPEVRGVDAAEAGLGLEEEKARIAPLFPSLQAAYAAGGFGGGRNGAASGLGEQQDYFVGFGWKIGPGGLLDSTRQRLATMRRESAGFQKSRVKAAVGREVVEAAVRSQSAHDQIQIADSAVESAEEMTQLAEQRQASQIGVVQEIVLARDEVTRARLARIRAVVEFNRTQQALWLALGQDLQR